MTTNDKKPDPWTSKADNGSNSTTIAIIVAALVLVVGAFIFFGSTTTTPDGRYCCKSLFASLNTSFPGRGCGALTTMWGTTLLGAKLTGDLGNAPEGTSTSDYCLFPHLAGNLSFGILGLLQQYRPAVDTKQHAPGADHRTCYASGECAGHTARRCAGCQPLG